MADEPSEKCGTCKGEGGIWQKSANGAWITGYWTCPSCKGTGRRPRKTQENQKFPNPKPKTPIGQVIQSGRVPPGDN